MSRLLMALVLVAVVGFMTVISACSPLEQHARARPACYETLSSAPAVCP